MILVNGDPSEVPAGTTVRGLLDHLELPGDGRGVAVAVDAQVVPRGEWERFAVPDGAKVEVLQAVQGG